MAVCKVRYFQAQSWAKQVFHIIITIIIILISFFRSLADGAHQGRGETAAFFGAEERLHLPLCVPGQPPASSDPRRKPASLCRSTTATCPCRGMNPERQPQAASA